MRILVTASSKHGATAEIADAIAERLRGTGWEVVRQNPEDVVSLDGIDAVVCGSAVYMTQWMPGATAFLQRFETQLAQMPVWAFSVGLSGVPKHSPQDPSRIGPVLLKVHVVHHQVFPGRYDPELLSLRERSIVRLAGGVEGDFRDWQAVGEWTDSIIAELRRTLPAA
ncbi:MAG: flavodoxin domain-containing protein [Actinomyces sp.]|jgi:menaquinone-dependent protoporphyrinogen oxidase|nr:flavodoxin domain-containing protein [Actinomyces sp.]MCI1642539.1 flavodoxin domain-containing protein [Actinomyces sp.]MCI1663133.1 flavodoxin domain-containing protein [Actinomyces sp.]MCI1691287.1 flavodoxin domain-containing protein [Actinomyces sp.]MCI1787684.1 flavodoxin domain-containing protein [Actinomyces sp.]MCI1830408.1 flavodoxin domain-containing protein [Actinomyces sp.]